MGLTKKQSQLFRRRNLKWNDLQKPILKRINHNNPLVLKVIHSRQGVYYFF